MADRIRTIQVLPAHVLHLNRLEFVDFTRPRICLFMGNVLLTVSLLIACLLGSTPWYFVHGQNGFEYDFTLTGSYVSSSSNTDVVISNQSLSEYGGSCETVGHGVQTLLSLAVILTSLTIPVLHKRGCGADRLTVRIILGLLAFSILFEIIGISVFFKNNECLQSVLQTAGDQHKLKA
jgi:hypothetical protein